ncbi:SgcJ/EcaC family oxidoreductase [Streptomyces sp. R41]|uniref:SgcJ/EcaC family oxidoreductase n=1 Tax=Streptomyces sp. R41 TaxID=3238632 RepID=A0AB39RP95_9ACTN
MTSTTDTTPVQTARSDAERAVLAVLDGVYTAWAANDPDAFVADYAADATALLPGTHLRDKEEIRAAMAAAFAGPLKGSRAVHDVQSVRFPGPGTALVISKGAILLAGETEPRSENRALDSWVLSEQDGAWRVQGFHNCPEHTA